MSSTPPEPHAVFSPDGSRYHTFRIPALLALTPSQAPDTEEGVLLAFCEGRIESARDTGPIDLVLRRSLDRGRSWEPLQVVCTAAEKTCGNPVPLYDPGSGDVVLVSVQNGARAAEAQLADGSADAEDERRVFVQRSSDLGLSWSDPVEITADVKHPDWGWYATGPCHGITVQHGGHRGRLVVPANHSRIPAASAADDHSTAHDHPVPHDQLAPYNGGHALLSDDGGHSWRIGFIDQNDDSVINANETTVAELADGRLVFNSRNHKGSGGSHRLQAVSFDGGSTLAQPYAECPEISAPQIQASMISPDGHTLLLSVPSVTDSRRDLRIYVSDDAEHWRPGALVHEGPSGYSDLAALPEDQVAILYEGGSQTSHDQILFVVRPLAELTVTGDEAQERTNS